MINLSRFFYSLSAIILLISCGQSHYSDALSPEEAKERMILREGFRIELFAAEPHVKDPVEMVVDENGKMYVVEMPDYPFKPEPGKQKSRIKVILDRNGDGRIDHSVVFANQLMEATSILPWDGGIIATAAPDILYLKDTTGDDRADIQQVLFTGFFENNSEAQITNLRFNIDNWIYASNFGQAGKITSPLFPDKDTLIVNGGDFRFRLDTFQYEVAAGPTQFGQGIDDWGNRFVTQNSLHIRQIMIPWRYLHRHDGLPSTDAIEQISDHDPMMYQLTPPPYWREERTRRRQATYHERGLDRIEYAANNFTGATGTTVYSGDAFPDEFYGSIFIGDVAGNLIHRDVISYDPELIEATAQRDPKEYTREFLVSADPWFRPVNFYSGPDGNLFVIDMYRQHIETPLAIPEDLKAEMYFYNGKEKGRIYKIVQEDSTLNKTSVLPQFSNLSLQQLSNLLTHENGWWRLSAQRVMIQQKDLSVIPYLKQLLSYPKAQTRLQAMYTLEALKGLDTKDLQNMLRDVHPAVRRHAIVLAETRPELLSTIINMIGDTTRQVKMQLALSLGEFEGKEVVSALADILEEEHGNSWFRKAVLSSIPGTSLELFTSLEQKGFFQQEDTSKQVFLKEYVYVMGLNPEATVRLFELAEKSGIMDNERYQVAMVEGIRERLNDHGNTKLVQKLDQAKGLNPVLLVKDIADQEASAISQ